MSEENPRYFSSIKEWRDWLKANHNEGDFIWVITQKKASKKPGIRYDEAVLEAVAHGWIDGRMKRLNDDDLMAEGRITPAGLKTVEAAKENGRWEKAYKSRIDTEKVPDDLLTALQKNKTAHENFESFPPYARFMYIRWINEAKREDTRERRIYTIVDRSEKNLKPGIDLRINKKPT